MLRAAGSQNIFLKGLGLPTDYFEDFLDRWRQPHQENRVCNKYLGTPPPNKNAKLKMELAKLESLLQIIKIVLCVGVLGSIVYFGLPFVMG